MPRRAPRERKSPSPAPADPPAEDPPPSDPEPAPEVTPADDPSPPDADADTTADAGDADPSAPADADADASPEKVRTCLRMTVSIRLAGYLIGHKGAHVKYVRDQTRCGVHVQDALRSAPSDAMRCVVVTSTDTRDTDDGTGTGTGTGTPTGGRDALVRCWRRMTESQLPSTAPPATIGARPPDAEYAARLLVPASQMVRLDPIAVVADPTVTVEVDERPADDPALVSCALPNDRAVRISGPDDCVYAALGRLADALDYRVNPADPADDPLLIIKNPDVVADYHKDRALAKAKIRRGGYGDHSAVTAVPGGADASTISGKPWGRVTAGVGRDRDAPSDRGREHGLRRALRPDEIMVEFDVDAVSAGGIIGKRGATIAQIRKRCGVLATVRADAPKGAARTVEIVGKEPNAMRAKAEIEAKVREENPKYGRCTALRITEPGGTPRGDNRGGDRPGYDRGYDRGHDRGYDSRYDRDRERERYDDRERYGADRGGWAGDARYGADRGYDRDRERGGYHPYAGGGESRPARSYSARDYAPGRRSQGRDGGGYHQPPAREYEYGGGGWGHGQHPPPARWDAGEDGYDRGGGFDARAPPRYDQGWQHQQPQSHAQYHQQQPPPQQQQQTYGAPAYQQQQHAYGDPYHQQPPSQQSYASQQHPGDGYGGATQQQYRY